MAVGQARRAVQNLIGGGLVLLLLSSGSLGAAARGVPPSTAGSAGAGDAYFPRDGNGGYDVGHYDIRNRYQFARARISGRTRVTARATQTLTSFNLDFLLPVTAVTVDGRPARFTRPDGHELRVTPARTITDGDRFHVVVEYAGNPDRLGWAGERNWLANRDEVVTMNEPHMAAWWFPSSDHPRDKASVDIRITVPRGRQVIANGVLKDRDTTRRWTTWHWRAKEPMAPYLAFFAAGRFRIEKGTHRGLPWLVAVSRQLPRSARRSSMRLMRSTPRVIAWLERQVGPYPFATSGGVTTGLGVNFALENQTRPTYPQVGGLGAIDLVVHEQAHQWFGDSVSVDSWSDIWLNEGFATFMEKRYAETHGGQTAARWLEREYARRGAASGFWDLRIGDPGRGHLFDAAVYDRGGMAVQALRNRIGDGDFWQVLRRWVSDRADGNGSVAQFRSLAEEVSGEDLAGFFTAWLYADTRPARTGANGLA